MRRILILGGTTEARRLAERLAKRADLAVTVSLAGRTKAPPTQAAPVRIGGFGGAQGLADYLTTQHVDMLIDATHPYAANISGNAAEAAAIARVPLLALRRPPWAPRPGDNWTDVADPVAAVQALGQSPRRVFLALGRNEIGCFTLAPQHYYLVRSVDQVDPPLAVPRAAYVTGRGPFTEADDRGLLSAHAIDIVVARNSGGTATYGKIAAARALGLAVMLLRRPALPEVPTVATVDDAVTWLDHARALRIERGV
jgi:precorrin-6A/cobalt-precorrin-6A reductase